MNFGIMINQQAPKTWPVLSGQLRSPGKKYEPVLSEGACDQSKEAVEELQNLQGAYCGMSGPGSCDSQGATQGGSSETQTEQSRDRECQIPGHSNLATESSFLHPRLEVTPLFAKYRGYSST